MASSMSFSSSLTVIFTDLAEAETMVSSSVLFLDLLTEVHRAIVAITRKPRTELKMITLTCSVPY